MKTVEVLVYKSRIINNGYTYVHSRFPMPSGVTINMTTITPQFYHHHKKLYPNLVKRIVKSVYNIEYFNSTHFNLFLDEDDPTTKEYLTILGKTMVDTDRIDILREPVHVLVKSFGERWSSKIDTPKIIEYLEYLWSIYEIT